MPEDISLISFDDTDAILSAEGYNILTTIRAPLHQIGREAAEIMVRSIESDAAVTQEVVLPVELVVRQSTGPVKSISGD